MRSRTHRYKLFARLAALTGLTIDDIESRVESLYWPAMAELEAFLSAYPASTEQHEEGKALLAGYSTFSPEHVMQGIKRIAPDYETLEENLMRSVGEPGEAPQ